MPVELTVVGSINLDLVARVDALPRAGETVFGTEFTRVPGGKGANQAVAAARLGGGGGGAGGGGGGGRGGGGRWAAPAATAPLAEEALAGLRAAGVELEIARTG